jgi:hypothetical protein
MKRRPPLNGTKCIFPAFKHFPPPPSDGVLIDFQTEGTSESYSVFIPSTHAYDAHRLIRESFLEDSYALLGKNILDNLPDNAMGVSQTRFNDNSIRLTICINTDIPALASFRSLVNKFMRDIVTVENQITR